MVYKIGQSQGSGTVILGCRSDTDDITGQVAQVATATPVNRNEIEAALGEFRGPILQTPPPHSAIQVGGKRAYDLARAGQTVQLAAREVEVHRLDMLSFEWPFLRVDIDCSSGTYIRSIGRDLGERLGIGGLMTKLERTSIGPCRVEKAIDPASLTKDSLASFVLDPLLALPGHERIVLATQQIADFRQGRAVAISQGASRLAASAPIAAVDETDRLIALARWSPETGRLHPELVFAE